jgi:hypothetical protein
MFIYSYLHFVLRNSDRRYKNKRMSEELFIQLITVRSRVLIGRLTRPIKFVRTCTEAVHLPTTEYEIRHELGL